MKIAFRCTCPCTESCKCWSPVWKNTVSQLLAVWTLVAFQLADNGPWGGLATGPCCVRVPAGRGEPTAVHRSLPDARKHKLQRNEWMSAFAFPAALIFSFLLCCGGAGSGLSSELENLEVMCWWHKYTWILKILNGICSCPEHFILENTWHGTVSEPLNESLVKQQVNEPTLQTRSCETTACLIITSLLILCYWNIPSVSFHHKP